MKEQPPLSASDPRPGNKPYYINSHCAKCGALLVLNDLLENPNIPVDEIWYDEFICPVCKDKLYMDWPSNNS